MMSFESLYIPVISWSLSLLMNYHIPVISLQICDGDGLKASYNHMTMWVISQGISKITRHGENFLISSCGRA